MPMIKRKNNGREEQYYIFHFTNFCAIRKIAKLGQKLIFKIFVACCKQITLYIKQTKKNRVMINNKT